MKENRPAKRRMRPTALSLLLLSMAAYAAAAQPADTLVAQATELARFREARALAVDPAGRLYVVDAGQDAVLQLDAGGRTLAVVGGPGSGEGEFDQPADVDPTNGLVLVVADAGNSRLQRFSRTFLPLESLPVARIDRFTPGAATRTAHIGQQGSVAEADGRPVAVATSSANETFAVDAAQKIVLKWDASRRFERAVGGFDAGEGALVDPVALAADAQTLFVADRGQAAVLVYDLFGGYVRTLAPGRAADVQALNVAGGRLWIVLPRRILVYETRGRLLRTLDVDLGEPLVDALRFGDAAYLLTPTRLLRAPL